MEDLWPTAIGENVVRAPATILKEQATLLSKRTKGIVTARLFNYNADRGLVRQGFLLEAPALGDYRTVLFEITSSIEAVYPPSISGRFFHEGKLQELVWKPVNETELAAVLKEIFQNERTVKAINSLLALSEGLSLPSKDEVPF